MIQIPAIVAAELFTGALKSTNSKKAFERVREFLFPYEIVPFETKAALQYGHIRSKLEKAGKTIGGNDLLIVATVLAHNATLVSNNVREFHRVPDLRVEKWA